MTAPLPDGLYQVTHHGICAGFVVAGGRVTRCAPILRRSLASWLRAAVRVSA